MCGRNMKIREEFFNHCNDQFPSKAVRLFHVVCILCCGCFNWFCNVWMCVRVCVHFVICGYFDNCVGVLVICVLVFTVFLYYFVYGYSFLFVVSVLV